MKTSIPFILTAALAIATATTSQAAVINWSAPQAITADSDVSTAGTLIGAFKLEGSNTTVNTVTFQSLSVLVGSTSVTSGNFTLTTPGFNTVTTGGGGPGGLSSAYTLLLRDVATSASPLVLSIGGLIAGQTYQFEWWCDFSDFNANVGHPITTATAGNTVTLDSNTTSMLGGRGQFATGTFVADGTLTQSIAFTSANNVLVDAFQLRAIPEPSTWALLGLGLPALLAFRRSRR